MKVLVNGCNGKMGQEVAKRIKETEEVETLCGVDRIDTGDNSFPVFETSSLYTKGRLQIKTKPACKYSILFSLSLLLVFSVFFLLVFSGLSLMKYVSVPPGLPWPVVRQ